MYANTEISSIETISSAGGTPATGAARSSVTSLRDSPAVTLALHLHCLGYSVVPATAQRCAVTRIGKRAELNGKRSIGEWKALADEAQVRGQFAWAAKDTAGHGLDIADGDTVTAGLLSSGLCVLDIDSAKSPEVLQADPQLRGQAHGLALRRILKELIAKTSSVYPDKFLALLMKQPFVRSPSGGWHIYFRNDSGLRIATVTKALGIEHLDIRADGGFIMAPGAKIASGKVYAPYRRRVDDGKLRTVAVRCPPLAGLPVLPNELIAVLKMPARAANAAMRTVAGAPGALTPDQKADITSALKHLARQPDLVEDYDNWRDIGLSLASAADTGELSLDEAKELFRGASQAAANYPGDEACDQKLEHIGADGSRNWQSILYDAAEEGWINPKCRLAKLRAAVTTTEPLWTQERVDALAAYELGSDAELAALIALLPSGRHVFKDGEKHWQAYNGGVWAANAVWQSNAFAEAKAFFAEDADMRDLDKRIDAARIACKEQEYDRLVAEKKAVARRTRRVDGKNARKDALEILRTLASHQHPGSLGAPTGLAILNDGVVRMQVDGDAARFTLEPHDPTYFATGKAAISVEGFRLSMTTNKVQAVDEKHWGDVFTHARKIGCPGFGGALSHLCSGDAPTARFVLGEVGTALLGLKATKFGLFFDGAADSGKSTLLKVLHSLIGPGLVRPVSLAVLAGKAKLDDTLALVRDGARIIFDPELGAAPLDPATNPVIN